MKQLLNQTEAAELIGVSERTFNSLRREAWFPLAIDLGPRSLRWDRDELLGAIKAKAKRVAHRSEPSQLAKSRAWAGNVTRHKIV